MLLWSVVGGQLRTRSWEGPFRGAFGKKNQTPMTLHREAGHIIHDFDQFIPWWGQILYRIHGWQKTTFTNIPHLLLQILLGGRIQAFPWLVLSMTWRFYCTFFWAAFVLWHILYHVETNFEIEAELLTEKQHIVSYFCILGNFLQNSPKKTFRSSFRRIPSKSPFQGVRHSVLGCFRQNEPFGNHIFSWERPAKSRWNLKRGKMNEVT